MIATKDYSMGICLLFGFVGTGRDLSLLCSTIAAAR